MSSMPENGDVDAALLEAHDIALAALHEITPAATVGDPAGHLVERDGVVSLLFANRMLGYPGWYWTVSLARTEDAAPTVLEVELLPGEGALLAPEWVPWAVRLAEYQAQQAAAKEQAAAEAAESDDAVDASADNDADADDLDDDDLDEDDLGGDLDDELVDVDDLDAADFDEDGSPHLHAGDVDGVDIDELDDDLDEDDDEDDDLEDEDDDDLDDEDDDLEDEDDDEEDEDMGRKDDEFTDDDFVSDEDDLGEQELDDAEN